MKEFRDGVEPGGVYRFAPIITSNAAMLAATWVTLGTVSNANLAYLNVLDTNQTGTYGVRITMDGQTITTVGLLAAPETYFSLDANSDTIVVNAGAAPVLLGYGVPLYAGYATVEVQSSRADGAGVYTWSLRYYAT